MEIYLHIWPTVSALSAEAYTTTWLVMVTYSPPVAVSKQSFRHGNKNTLFSYLVYSALFNNLFKAFNLFLNKYIYIDKNSAVWQYHLAALHTTEVLHRVLTWLDNGD